MGWLSDLFGGGGSNKTTTTTNSAPWSAAQPALKLGLNEATKLFKQNPDGSYFKGNTVIDWSNRTKQGMGDIQALANANRGGNGLSGQYQNIINQGGMNSQQQQAANALAGVVGGSGLTPQQTRAMQGMQGVVNSGGYNAAQNAAMGGLNNIIKSGGYNQAQNNALASLGNTMNQGGYNAAMRGALGGFQSLANNPFNAQQSAAMQNTQDLANSTFDTNANPAFQQVLKQAQDSARDSVNMSAGASGRYGGGVHQGNLASEVGDLTSRMVGDEYRNWQGRKDAANNNLFQMGQTGIGTQLAAQGNVANLGQSAQGNLANAQNSMFNMGQAGLGNVANAQNSLFNMGQTGQSNVANAQNSIFNMGQTGQANRMGAAGNLYQMGQGAIGSLNTAYQGMKNPAQDLMQVGGMEEDLATRQMNEKLRLWNDKFNAPWEQIGRLNAIASGAGQMGSTQTTAQPGQNPFLSALGYGFTGAGLLGGL